jgi:histidyl-tRNA synthetase
MTNMPQPVRGTQSLLGEDADRFHAGDRGFRSACAACSASSASKVPVIEQTLVFARTIGETTDVVSKEMYTFEDRGGESDHAAPEFTAGICRAYLSEGWQQYRAAEARRARPGLPLRAAAEGTLPPVPPARRRDHRRRAPRQTVRLLSLGDQLLRELGIHEA